MSVTLTRIIRMAMAECAVFGYRKLCDDCPLMMYCPAVK